jgi:hypothetical protein
MVKNWILLGDEAFEGSESTWGRIELSKEQQSNWQNIVMEQLNSAIEKSAKVREMIDNSNFIELDFYFFEKPKVKEEEVDAFIKLLEERFKDKQVFHRVSFNREFSWVFIDFMNVNFQAEEEKPEEDEKICIDENGNPMSKRNSLTVSLRDLAGEWTEYEYRDVKGKVEQDGQYKIILKGKEYNLEGIKHPNDDYDEYISRELTTILKSSFLYFVEVDQSTIIAMPDENYIKEHIEWLRKSFEDAIENSGEILIDRRAYPVLDFCLNVQDLIESKEAKKIIEQWERIKLEDGERAIQEIKNSDSKDLKEEEIELLNKLLEK